MRGLAQLNQRLNSRAVYDETLCRLMPLRKLPDATLELISVRNKQTFG